MEVLILEGDESDEVKFEIKELEYRINDLKKTARKVSVDITKVQSKLCSLLRYNLFLMMFIFTVIFFSFYCDQILFETFHIW